MADEPEWQRFASFTESRVRESLYAADVECARPASPEPDAMVQFRNVRDMPNRSIERSLLGRIQSLPSAREVEIDTAVIATGLGIAPAQIQALMQAGKIFTLCERGTGEDQG